MSQVIHDVGSSSIFIIQTKKKKMKKIQRMVSARMKVCVSSKGTQSRGFSPKAEGEENYLKNEETTCVT